MKDDEFAYENIEFKMEIPSLELRLAQKNTPIFNFVVDSLAF